MFDWAIVPDSILTQEGKLTPTTRDTENSTKADSLLELQAPLTMPECLDFTLFLDHMMIETGVFCWPEPNFQRKIRNCWPLSHYDLETINSLQAKL